jgi:hypothetical protein
MCILLSGCATPRHTNTMVFATSTRTAIDVSSDPSSGNLGITIGYKRLEAAWVPLLANQSDQNSSALIPSKCDGLVKVTQSNNSNETLTKEYAPEGCAGRFQGTDGTITDAYSVIGTFSGSSTGAAGAGSGTGEVKAGGSIAQFFATGLAAQKLALKGGAALFNTSEPILDANSKQKIIDEYNSAVVTADQFVKLVAPNDTIDSAKLASAIDATNVLSPGQKERLKTVGSASDLRRTLLSSSAFIEALPTLINNVK